MLDDYVIFRISIVTPAPNHSLLIKIAAFKNMSNWEKCEFTFHDILFSLMLNYRVPLTWQHLIEKSLVENHRQRLKRCHGEPRRESRARAANVRNTTRSQRPVLRSRPRRHHHRCRRHGRAHTREVWDIGFGT